MKLTKFITRRHFIFLIILALIYLGLNLTFIRQFPIFTDEAIYVRWTQIAANDASLRYISLIDGKQPLMIWIGMVPVKLFSDSLLAMRAMSVIYGLISLVGVYLLGRVYKNSLTGLIAASLFLTSPFFFIYNRLALYESLISAIGVICLLLITILAKKRRFDLSMILGFVLGLGLLTKSSANFFIYTLPFSLLTVYSKKIKFSVRIIIENILFFGISVLIAYAIFNALRLFPLFNMINQKDHTFILSFSEFFQNPTYLIFGNMPTMLTWAAQYLTPLLSVIFIFSFVHALITLKYSRIYLIIWILFPLLSTAFFGKIIYPRYILYLFPAVFLLIALFCNDILETVKNKKTQWVFLIALFIGPILGCISIILNPSDSIIPRNDKNQLIDDWPAGGGIEQSIKIIENAASSQKVFVGTEGTFGLLPYALEIKLVNNPNIEIKGYYPVKEVPVEVLAKSETKRTFFIYNLTQDQKYFSDSRLKLLGEYKKGSSDVYLRIFEVSK